MSVSIRKTVVFGFLLALCLAVFAPARSWAQSTDRKVKTPGEMAYPELARKMHITGTVKVEVVIAPNGTVKSAKAIGGHPLLIDAAVDKAKKTKFEPGPSETTQTLSVEFKLET